MPEVRMVSNPNYFSLPKPVPGTLVLIGMVLFFLTLFNPTSAILGFLGPIGTFVKYLHKEHLDLMFSIFYVGIGIRACEAVAARYIALQKGLNMPTRIKWLVQTFLIGFPSLMALTDYKGNKSS